MTLSRDFWKTYSAIRSFFGKEKAEAYRHEYRKEHAPYWCKTRESIWKEVKLMDDEQASYSWEIDYKAFLPYHMSEDEWKEFVEDEWIHWTNPWDDGRDCTGVQFTTGMSRFEVPHGTWVYHFTAHDI